MGSLRMIIPSTDANKFPLIGLERRSRLQLVMPDVFGALSIIVSAMIIKKSKN